MNRTVALSANDDRDIPMISYGCSAWFETAVITVLSAAVALWASASGPASFQASCMWLLGPLVCGLRHGSRYGLASAACLVAVAAVWFIQQMVAWPHVTNALAIVLVGFAAGETSDWWRRRLGYLKAESRYHRLRLEEFSREYHSLRLSHASLEQKVAAGGGSLRTALSQLNQRIIHTQASSSEPLGGLGEVILRVFADHAPLHIAALYAFSKPDQFTLCARLGDPPALSATNFLMQMALRTGQVANIPSPSARDVEGVIAVVPLTDVNGQTQAMLAIYEMPYATFHASTLGLLAVIGAHIADLLKRNARASALAAKTQFLSTLLRCMEDQRRCGLPFGLIVFKPNPAMVKGRIVGMMMSSRGIDHTYAYHDTAGQLVVLKLMPLTNLIGATDYVRRLGSASKLDHEPLNTSQISHFIWSGPQAASGEESLQQFFKRCGIRLPDGSSDIRYREEKVGRL